MIVRTDLLKGALKVLKKTAGSFVEDPLLYLSSEHGKLFLKTQEACLQTTVILESTGKIPATETLFNPFYEFISNNHSKAIEIKLNNAFLQLISFRTQEQLSLPARRAEEDPLPLVYHNSLSVRIKDLCRSLDTVTSTIGFSPENDSIIVFSQKHLYGFRENFMVRCPFPLSIQKSFISYETARRFLKTLKCLPDERISFFNGLNNYLKFENRADENETVLFLKTVPFPKNIPKFPALEEIFSIRRDILVKQLKKLINIAGNFSPTAELFYDGLNLNISQNSRFKYKATLTTCPVKYRPDSISLFIKPLARFLSAHSIKMARFLTGKDAWAVKLKENILVMFRRKI